MKPQVLQLSAILIPEIREALERDYQVERLFDQPDRMGFLQKHGPLFRGLITGGHTGVSREVLELLPNLEVIAVNGVGTDAIDLGYARDRRIKVTATIGALTEDVADLAVGLLISACRGICTSDRFVRSGAWGESPTPLAPLPLARQVSGMRVGILGMGKVGRAVASRLAAFNCEISYCDLSVMPDVPHRFVAGVVDLAKGVDALIVAAAADNAAGIIDREVLEALGKDGYLINVARGKLVNEADLIIAMQSGLIAGAGLDVFVDEPHVPEALTGLEQIVLQPHRASATIQTRTRMGNMVLSSLAAVFTGQEPPGLVQ